jgi:hypothetical protein
MDGTPRNMDLNLWKLKMYTEVAHLRTKVKYMDAEATRAREYAANELIHERCVSALAKLDLYEARDEIARLRAELADRAAPAPTPPSTPVNVKLVKKSRSSAEDPPLPKRQRK